ncbi:MAG: hypothetical protein M3Y68_06930, partial [Chloroflexota bacterium]|nr:hypothetical protein [Chloroflexota bacterium]
GTLPWQFNEPYPMAACTSAVDYYARPKPSYYAVSRAYAPLLITARFNTLAWGNCEHFEAEVWINNSHERSYSGVTVQTRLVGVSGKIYAEHLKTVSFDANSPARLAALQAPLEHIPEEVFFLDLQLLDVGGASLAQNRYVHSRTTTLAPLFACPPATLSVAPNTVENGQRLTLTNVGDSAAMFVWVEDALDLTALGYAFFEDNYFCLLPEESRTVRVAWKDVPAGERRLEISAWNAERVLLESEAHGAGGYGRI